MQAIATNCLDRTDASATELALLDLIDNTKYENFSFAECQKKYLTVNKTRFMFTSKRKKMSTVLENVEETYSNTGYRLHVKGAAEIILAKCSHYLDESGSRQSLDDNMKQLILSQINSFAEKSLRNILFAYKDLTNDDNPPHFKNDKEDNNVEAKIERDGLTMIAFVGIKDPIRPEVPLAVKKCKMASIVVRMVTGDNLKTAMAIAVECGIISEEEV